MSILEGKWKEDKWRYRMTISEPNGFHNSENTDILATEKTRVLQ